MFIREEMAQATNFLENILVNRGKLASLTTAWLSSTTILTSLYFPGIFFLIKYQEF